MARQDFLLQPYIYAGSNEVVWDFPLDDFFSNGVRLPTPYGDSDNQHKIDVIVNNLGSIKQFPLLGFGVFKWQNSEFKSDIIFNSLSDNMKKDLYKVQTGAVKPNQSGMGFTIDTELIIPNY